MKPLIVSMFHVSDFLPEDDI